MMKLFRNIRRNLVGDGIIKKPASLSEESSKTPWSASGPAGRYLFYALGEILLVMIGILLALQVNNWNERRKVIKFENELLKDIALSIEGNNWQLKRSITGSERHIASAEIILSHFQDGLPYHDSLDYHFSQASNWNEPTIRNAGYESLKTYGLHTITNDTIRKSLNIYDAGWLEILNNRLSEYHYNTAAPILTDLFQSVDLGDRMKPNNYEDVKESLKYATVLKTSIAHRKSQIKWYAQWQDDLEKIEKMIERELKRN